MRGIGATVTIIDNGNHNSKKGLGYDVYVQDSGPSKLALLKYVKETACLGLKEAKDLVDTIPNTIFVNCDYQTANTLAKEMRGIGATVNVINTQK